MLNPILAKYIKKKKKNNQKSDYVDGFCLQG